MPDTPILDRNSLETTFGKYNANTRTPEIPQQPFQGLPSPNNVFGTSEPISPLEQMEQDIFAKEAKRQDGKLTGGSIPFSFKDLSSTRYSAYNPDPNYDNEDAFAQSQGFWDKAANGVTKMAGIAATTALSSSLGLINGSIQWASTGKFSSFYDNEFTRSMDDFNKSLEDKFPHYTTSQERASDWYEPSSLLTANFLFDKIIKNLGYAVGAAVPAGYIGRALQATRLSSKLFAAGEALAATEAIEAASLLPRVQQLSNISNSLRTIAGDGVKALGAAQVGGKESAGFLVKALSSTLASSGEASLEAYSNLNEFRNAKIAEYKAQYGVEPTDADLDNINKQAENIGNASFALNMALLSGTQYVQLPKIFSSTFKGEKALLNETIRKEGGLLKSVLPASGISKKLYQGRNIASLFFNAPEAFEEGAQYAVQKGTQDYYNKKYRGQEADLISSLGEGIYQGFLTSEGLENVALGGLSGALMTSGIISTQGIGKTGKIAERGFTGYGGQRAANTEQLIEDTNKYRFSQYLKEGVEQSNRAVVLQQDRERAIRQGDILESKDLEFDYSHNYLAHRIKWDRYDLVKDDIAAARQEASTLGGFERLQEQGQAAQTDTQAAFLQRLSNFEKHADNVKNNYESLNNKYSGIVNEDGKPKYTPEVIDQLIYAASKVQDYDQRIPELSASLISKGIQIQQVLEEALFLPISEKETLKDRTEYEKAIIKEQNGEELSPIRQALKDINSLNTISEVKDDLKQQLQDVIELSIRRKGFIDEYNKIKTSPKSFESPSATVETKPGETLKTTVEVKTKDGTENVEVGTEYYLGKVTELSPEGKEVYRFPTLTILGENEDGTIKIKDSNGQIRDVSKAVLEDYKLGKVSDLENNKKAKFFKENINTIFQFNFGKGKKVNGRLEYSPKANILNFIYKDAQGKIRSIEVTGDQFVPKKGYTSPMISAIGQLSVGQQKALDDYAQEKDARTSAKRGNRLQIISELFEDTSKKLDGTKKLLQQKYSQLEKIVNDLRAQEEKIKGGTLTKRNNFKATTNRAIKAANALSRMQEQLVQEIQELEAEQEQLEFQEAYIADVAQNIDELPTDSKEFLEELNNQVLDLQILHEETGKQINATSKLIDNVEKALQSAIDFILELLGSFTAKYPKVPTEYGQEWVDFLKENPNFLKLKPNFKEDLATVDELVGQVDDLDVQPNERTAQELRGELEKLQASLSEIERELAIKEKILAKFNEAVQTFKQEEAKKKEFLANKKVQETYFVQQKANEQYAGEPVEENNGTQPSAVKDLSFALASSTNPPWVDSRDGSVPETGDDNFHRRHQSFLFNQTSSNPDLFSQEEYKGKKVKDRLRIIPVTSVSAQALGFPEGWIEPEYAYTGDNPSTAAIRYVYVVEEGDKLFYVDVKGNKISEVKPSTEQLDPSQIVYTNAETAKSANDFTDKDKLAGSGIIAEWENIRKQMFAITADNIQNFPREFKVSRGFPATTPGVSRTTNIIEAQLVTEQDLETNVVIQIPTASSKFPVGIPLLNFNGNTVFLNNRNFSKEEASNIYDVLVYAASSTKGLTNEVFNYLRNVLYFSTSVKDGVKRNQIFLKDDEGVPTLVIGANEVEIPFIGFATEDGNDLVSKKDEIIQVLQNMYHHVNNNTLLQLKNKPNTPFQEIGVKDGELYTKREFPSYQHYLLTGPAAPLTANINIPQEGEPPIKEKYAIVTFEGLAPTKFKPTPQEAAPAPKPETITREAKGFKITATVTRNSAGTVENVAINSMVATQDHKGEDGKVAIENGENVTKQFAASLPAVADSLKEALNTEAPKPKPKEKTPVGPKRMVMDGVTINTASTSKGEVLSFTISPEGVKIVPDDIYLATFARLLDTGISEDNAAAAIMAVIKNAYLADKALDEQATQKTIDKEENTPPQAPVAVDKKADIEIGKVGNTEYEVKVDGVYYQGKKLNNPKNKTHRQLIEADIERRRQEELNNEMSEIEADTEEEFIKKVNAKYDAELAALEQPNTTEIADDLGGAGTVAYEDESENRLVLDQWNKYEGNKEQETEDISFMLPGVKVEMVENLIKTSGGGQAWGAARSAMMEIFKDAPFGTKYHEAFEQVFNWILSPKDQLALYEEFKQREGIFVTFKGETKKFSEAGFKEAKEQMAEEFIEYKQSNVSPKKSSKIVQFFKDLWNLLKGVFNSKPATLANVFNKLNRGAYRMAPIRTAKGVEYRERNVQGEAVSFVNTVLAGMTADVFIEKWKNDVNLIIDLEERPGYAEQELFNNLLARLTDYYENNQNPAGVIPYYTSLLKSAKTPEEKADVIAQYEAVKNAWKRVKGQWNNYTEDLKSFLKVFDVSFQVDDEGNIDIAPEIDSTEEKTQLQYVDDKMSINAKNSASKVVKLLLATVADSEFKKVIQNSLQTRGTELSQIIPIRDNVMRMRMLAPYAKLFNYVLYNTANIPGIYNMIDKLSTLSKNTSLKQNANVKALLNRIGFTADKGFEGMTIPQIKLILKLENAFSKNKPIFVRQELNEEGKTIFKFSNIYDRISQLTEQWGNGLKALKYTTTTGENIQFDKGILASDPYIFLSNLNIPITKNSFPLAKEKELLDNVDAIKSIIAKYIETPLPIISKGKGVGIDSRLNKLAKFYVENIEGESTESQHLNMAGKVTANFVLPNFISHILSDANVAETLEQFIELNPQYKDLYMGDSYLLNNVMYKDGKKNKSLNVVVVEGKNIFNEGRPTDKMNEGERILYEINNNLNGYYYSLVPADTKLEYAINTGNIVPNSFFNSQGKLKSVSDYTDLMYNTFLNEVALMQDYENRTNISALNRVQNGVEVGRQLRFFKYILSSANVSKVENGGTITKEEFGADLLKFIEKQAKENIADLRSWGLITEDNTLYGFDTNFLKENFNASAKAPKLSEANLLELMQFREMNYVFNNIEMHKLFFNDPAQWKDELKATKSFISGREATHVDTLNDQRGLNDALKNTLNKGLTPTDIGWTNFKNHLNAVTVKDIFTVSGEFAQLQKDLGKKSKKYGEMDIADGQSWAHGSAYREILYKSGGRFTAQQEELHQWLMAWERRDKNKYSSEALKAADAIILSKPIPSSNKHIMYILKPIVSGTKLVNGVAVQYLYKTSTAPLYAYFVKGTPMEGVHNKMTERGIDFLAMQSVNKRTGQLVDNTISMLGNDGKVSPEFNTVTTTPIDYKYFGIQVDTASKKEEQTQGSQLTKLAVVDLMSNGVPIDFINAHPELKTADEVMTAWEASDKKSKVKDLVQEHKDVLIALAIKRGEKVFNQLGIKEGEFGYTFRDKAIVADFILRTIEKRELPDNVKEGIAVAYNPETDSKEFVSPLEANVNYQKIKQILWSVIEKGVTRPKMPGGPKVQMSVAGMGNIKEVTINGKKAYVDDTLKYYGVDENGNTTPCEIDLPYFFGEQLRASLKAKGKEFATDEEFFTHILSYLNNTEEGQSLLKGIGFRIPTQKTNSLEYFKVRKFLAPQLGDVVVLPAEITTKAGSDFDVDKLNTYLKNWYIGKSGYPKVIKLQNISSTDTKKLTEIYEYTLKNKRKEWETTQSVESLFTSMFPDSSQEPEYVPTLEEFLSSAIGKSSLELNTIEALENHYIDTLEKLMELPENRKALLSPNDASQLDGLSQRIQKLTNNIDVDINPGHLISSNFMAKKRNTLLASKGSVGISAVSATNVAINQASDITIAVPNNFKKNNIAIRFPHNSINGQASLSGVYTTSGDNISDINSQFTDGAVDVAKKEWLPRLGFTDATISTALLMNTWGTPIEHIAFFINQPAIQAYLKAREINKIITKYTGKKSKENWEIQEAVNKQFTTKSIFGVRKAKPDEYKLSEMEDMLTKTTLSDKDNILQIQMLDDFIAYQAMAGERLSTVQGYNYDTARITSPEDMYKKELDEEKARKSSVDSLAKLTTNTYVGKVAEIAKELNKALKSLINTQTGKAGDVVKNMAYDLKKHFGIGNNADSYSKYMNKAESAMIDYIVQNKALINSLPLNSYTKDILSSSVSSARYIQKLKQDIANNPKHPLANNKLIQNFVTDIDPTNKKPSTVTIAEPDFDTFTSDSYTDQFRELLSSAATVELSGVKNSNRLVSKVFQNLVVAQILQNGSSRKQGSFFHLIPNEIYTEYAGPVLKNIEADLDFFYDNGLFYRNNYKDNKLVPILRPDFINEIDEREFASRIVLGKRVLLVNSSQYYSFPFTKIVDRATGITKLYKRIDSEDALGRKSPAKIKTAKDSDPESSLVQRVAYQEVNILGDGNKAQEYYEDKLTSLYNPAIEEVSDMALILAMENMGMEIFYENIPLLDEGNDLSSQDMTQGELFNTETPVPLNINTSKKINIYAGTNENAELSNFASRPFKLGDGITYPSVEHAFQLEKLQYSKAYTDSQRETIIADMIKKSAAQVKAFGKTIKGLNVIEWNKDASSIMKDLIKQSFESNPEAAKKLLATGNAQLTHTQDKGKWGTEFPKLLMEVRSELQTNTPSTEVKNSKVDLTPKANIPQNLVSGVEAFGTKQEANAEAKKALGANPHSIDMIEAGFRTRTTRSVGEMANYNVKVGDIVKQFGKSADGTTKNVLTRITAIHPKGTPGFLGTWSKEGWTQDGIKSIERFKDGAAAIEFELVKENTAIKAKSFKEFKEQLKRKDCGKS